MPKIYSSSIEGILNFRMHLLRSLLLMLGITCAGLVQAQQYTTPTGTSSNVFPLGNSATNKVQWLYLPSDFTPALPAIPQMITKLYVKVGSSPTSPVQVTFTNFTVSLGTNPTTSLVAGPWLTGLTTLINASTYTTPAIVYNGWFEIPLPTPYLYNPAAGNLIMELTQTGYTTAVYMAQIGAVGNRRAWGSLTSATSSVDNNHVQIGIDVMPACSDVVQSTMATSNVSTDEATITWNIPQMSIGFEYILSQTPTVPTSTVPTSTTNNFATLTNLTPNTFYYFHVRNICTGGPSYNWTTLGFSTMPCTLTQPPTSVQGNTTFCDGGITELSIPPVLGATYAWYHNGVLEPGATNNHFTAFLGGNYYAVMSKSGCLISSDTTNLTVHPAPVYSYTASSLDICEGATSTLMVNTTSNYLYQWQFNGNNIPGANANVYNAASTGAYRVLVTTTNCTDTSLTRNITKHPAPMPVINSTNMPVLSTSPGYLTYQWYLGGVPLPGTNTNTITATQNGSYTVSVVDQNGCKNLSSAVIVGPNSIAGLSGRSTIYKVYPNPTTGILQLEMPNGTSANLFTVDGKQLPVQLHNNELQMEHLSNGVYFLRFVDKNNRLTHIEKIIKQ